MARRRTRRREWPWLKTDGTDWHVKPEGGPPDECQLCGCRLGAHPHRIHPQGGWEVIRGQPDYPGLVVYIPPALPPVGEEATHA